MASKYAIEDVDTNGTIFLKPVEASNIAVSSGNLARKTTRLQTSFRLHTSADERERFKRLCRSRGTTMCRVLSDFIRACLSQDECVLEPKGIAIYNVFQGRPRGPAWLVASCEVSR